MNTISVFLLLTFLCLANTTPIENSSIDDIFNEEESNSNNQTFGLIGGKRSLIHEHPHTAAVIVQTSHEGSAVIINKRWVLTTGWNIIDEDPKGVLVRTGSASAIAGGQTSWAEKLIVHPKYILDWRYNLALIKLKTPLKFTKNTKPIKIADSTPSKGSAVLSGFGFTNRGKILDAHIHDGWLRESKLNILSYKECKKQFYKSDKSFTPNSFCTKSKTTEGPCFFDGGDPLVYKNKLIGIFGGTRTCLDKHYPPVYVDITKFKSWISKTIRKHSKEEELEELQNI